MNANLPVSQKRSIIISRRTSGGGIENVKKCIRNIESAKKTMKKLDNALRRELSIEPSLKRKWTAKAINAIVPKRIFEYFPLSTQKFVGEQYDVLMEIARLMRTNVINIQESLRQIAHSAIENTEETEALKSDIETAENENWSAQELQDYLAEQSGIQIYEEVRILLDQEFNGLTEEQKEARKVELIALLKNNIVMRQELNRAYGSACASLISVFHVGLAQDYAYNNVYPHIAVLRNASSAAINMNHSMFVGKTALEKTAQMAFQALEIAIDAAENIQANSIASTDFQRLLLEGKQNIDRRLRDINAKKEELLVLIPEKSESSATATPAQ